MNVSSNSTVPDRHVLLVEWGYCEAVATYTNFVHHCNSADQKCISITFKNGDYGMPVASVGAGLLKNYILFLFVLFSVD